MPANDGIWFDNEKDIGPTGPHAAEGSPKQPVASIQGWPRSLAFEHGELLAESEDFQGGIGSRTEEYRECTQHSDEELDHEILVVTQRAAGSIGLLGVLLNSLISRSDGVFSTCTLRKSHLHPLSRVYHRLDSETAAP
jgi:hypothetical protein